MRFFKLFITCNYINYMSATSINNESYNEEIKESTDENINVEKELWLEKLEWLRKLSEFVTMGE